MAISIIIAVTSVRIGGLIDLEAVNMYLSSLVSTFSEMLQIAPFQIATIVVVTSILSVLLFQHRQRIFKFIIGIAVLFSLGIWLSVIFYNQTGYNTQPAWLFIVLAINLTISTFCISMILSQFSLTVLNLIRR